MRLNLASLNPVCKDSFNISALGILSGGIQIICRRQFLISTRRIKLFFKYL